ncbi:MAG: hypothetical protein J6P94_03285 [Oscillospiraceae bacterium]|nr:hypothetical protein [Oscillospiraceae bacterium]
MPKILVIMAAGLGSRYGGDKQVVGAGPSNEILLEYSVYDAINSGFNKVVIIIKSGLEKIVLPIMDRMKSAHPSVEFCVAYQDSRKPFEGIEVSESRTKPLGTVHALLSAKDMIDGDFGVINADDFYGADAFRALSCAIDGLTEETNASLITYELNRTLSKNGTVTRGVCKVENKTLKVIYESYKIMKGEDGVIYETIGDYVNILPPETPVSMNMWGFRKETVSRMVDYLKDFLINLAADDNKSVTILPIMVADLRASGYLYVSGFSTNESWFGITYREDLPSASEELKARHLEGLYPAVLF